MNTACTELLRNIVAQTGAKIVLSTDWRRVPKLKQQLIQTLAENGMEVIGATPMRAPWQPVRPQEITAWLSAFNETAANTGHELITSFVAVDDRSLLHETGGDGLRGDCPPCCLSPHMPTVLSRIAISAGTLYVAHGISFKHRPLLYFHHSESARQIACSASPPPFPCPCFGLVVCVYTSMAGRPIHATGHACAIISPSPPAYPIHFVPCAHNLLLVPLPSPSLMSPSCLCGEQTSPGPMYMHRTICAHAQHVRPHREVCRTDESCAHVGR